MTVPSSGGSIDAEDLIDLGGPGGGVGGVLVFGAKKLSKSSTIRYLCPGTANKDAKSNNKQRFRIPRKGTLKNLHVRINDLNDVTSANPVVYTVRLNGVSTLLAVSINANVQDGSDLINSIPVTQGDLIDIEVTKQNSIDEDLKLIFASMSLEA